MVIRRPALVIAAFVALGTAASAQTFEMPLRKAGLWEVVMKISAGNMPAMTIQQCTDATTDKSMSTMFGSPQQACSEQKMQKNGDTITVDSVCTIGGAKSTTHAVIKGDFNSAYTVNVTSKREAGSGGAMMAPAAAGDTTIAMDAKWTGPCKPDQKAGDMIMPGGMKMNISDLQKMRQGGAMTGPPKGLIPPPK